MTLSRGKEAPVNTTTMVGGVVGATIASAVTIVE
jgi:hypothetical protein